MTILCEHERAIVYLVAHEGYNPSYKWTNPTYPTYNQGYNLLSKWDDPRNRSFIFTVEGS